MNTSKIKVQYVCSDGEKFDTQASAERHEKELVFSHENLRQQFLKSYDGAKLIKNHALNDFGIWQIYGESSNVDYSGSHHMPLLVTVQGSLHAAIDYAIDLDRFFTYGSGGKITKVVVDFYV